YRSGVVACSRTKQLAGALSLLREMRSGGVTPDAATYHAAISCCEVQQVRALP
ncbi:unnamed protein product, partial [Discosporangium mesarthrocarpum]